MAAALSVAVRHKLRSFRLEVDLEAGEETLALIGPSGAGKSTVLRTIAGLVRPDWARITCGERALEDTDRKVSLHPEQRRVGFVFQDGALFPNMTVAQNVAYGLRHASGRSERRDRVHELLERFRIADLARSRPGNLSGGERQRVALARAVATSPRVLLLDEPLSALDSSTRMHIAAQLGYWLHELRLPSILVSHDLTDVLGLADRVAVIEEGRIVQAGTSAELLQAPASSFVASFVGVNYFTGTATSAGATTQILTASGARLFSTQDERGKVGVIVDPWDITLCPEPPEGSALNMLAGPVLRIVEAGKAVRVTIESDPPVVAEITRESAARLELVEGTPVYACWKAAGTRLVSREGLEQGTASGGTGSGDPAQADDTTTAGGPAPAGDAASDEEEPVGATPSP